MSHEHHPGCPDCRRWSPLGRRRFLHYLGLGLAATIVEGCAGADRGDLDAAAHPTTSGVPKALAHRARIGTAQPAPTLPPIPSARPGSPHTISRGPAATHQIALTIDDGYCTDCVAAYVAFAARSGIHLTFSPNGTYQHAWNPHAATLRPLVAAGQVQIGNHTYSHHDLRKLADGDVRGELERNEMWIEKTFGITTRPWYRPPYGFHDERIDGVAGEIGYTNVLMWNGSLGDSRELTPDVLMTQAQKYVKAGVVLLGHANHPTVTQLFGQIEDLIRERGLTPVTLDEMFGTSRATG